MSETQFATLEAETDKQQADTSVLSSNKVRDLVEVANGNIIGNEQQMVIGHLALVTGWMYSHDRNVNTILTGPSAGGKSATQEAMLKALPSDLAYKASDASSMGVLDDNQWDRSLYAPLDEWQKIPEKLTEILKGVAGGPDDEYRYVRSVSDEDAESGRSGHTIIKQAKPFQFLYAQHALDHELSTRLVFLPIDDNVHVRDAIIESQGGAEHIDVEGYEKDFIFDTDETERALRQHLRELPTVEDDNENRRGATDAVLPPWVRKSVKPIFNLSSTETNRVAGQIFNLIRASAVLNHDERRQIEKEVDGVTLDAYVATPQDVANIMSCRETLLAKTHHLTDIKREIIDAIRAHQHFDDDSEGVGVTVDTIQQYLEDSSSMAVPRKAKLRDLLSELDEHFYIDIHERAGPNGAHLYEFKSLRDIGVPRVTGLTQLMNERELERCEDLCPGLDLDAPYADVGARDPFRDQPFVDTVEELRDEFAANPVERASKTAELVDEAASEGGDGGDPGGDGNDMTLADAMGVEGGDLERPDGPVTSVVYERLLEHADEVPWKVDEVEDLHLIGVLEEGEVAAETDLTGTLADPDHDVWDDPRKPDDWVTSQAEAERELEQAITEVERQGLLQYDMDDEVAPDGFVVTKVMDV